MHDLAGIYFFRSFILKNKIHCLKRTSTLHKLHNVGKGSSLQTGFQDVAFLPSRASFQPHFVNIVAEVKALGLRLWVIKGMIPVKYFCSTKPSFVPVKFHGDHKTATKIR